MLDVNMSRKVSVRIVKENLKKLWMVTVGKLKRFEMINRNNFRP